MAVRKRVIKLLRTFYSVSGQNERRVDICTKLVLRMNDEDDTVKVCWKDFSFIEPILKVSMEGSRYENCRRHMVWRVSLAGRVP